MSKVRRPPEREVASPAPQSRSSSASPEHQVESDLGRVAGPGPQAAAALSASPAADLAGRVSLALRLPQPDPVGVGRLAAVVERSALPEPRKAALADRLRADLALSQQVSSALSRALGRDHPVDRAVLIGALDRAVAKVGEGPAPARAVAEAVAASTGHPPEQVEVLCAALSGWIAWWEEEEEEALPGDYAAEESGA